MDVICMTSPVASSSPNLPCSPIRRRPNHPGSRSVAYAPGKAGAVRLCVPRSRFRVTKLADCRRMRPFGWC